MDSAGETADFLRDRQDFALNRPGVFVSHLFAAALQFSSHPESGSNSEIGHPSKGLNSHPPKGLTPKGLPLGQRTGATGLVRSGCRRCPRRTLLGHQASADKYYLELGQAWLIAPLPLTASFS